jgi:hypothetical protein
MRVFMPWHAEARATALYSMAALFTLIGVVGAASLWSFGSTGQEYRFQGTVVHEEIAMPSGAAATVLGGLILLGLLAMVYYQMVLSVYRGWYKPRTRMMARLAGGTTLIGMAGLVVARVGLVMVHEIQFPIMGDSALYIFNWNYPEVAFHATQDEFPTSWDDLAASLKGMYWLLFAGVVAALGGCIGTSAHSLGGESRRVRFAVALTFLAGFFLVGGACLGIMAGSNADQAADLFGGLDVETTTSSGIWAGIAGGFVGMLLGLVFVRYAGTSLVLSGIGLGGLMAPAAAPAPGTEGPAEPAEAPRAPPAEAVVVDAPPAEVEEVPIDVEEVEPGAPRVRRPLVVPGGTRGILAILVAIIVLAAGAWAIHRGGDGGGDDGGLPDDIVITELDPFQIESEYTPGHMALEGETETHLNAAGLAIDPTISHEEWEVTVYFVNRVEVEITWTDEPADNLVIDRWTNTPDTFSLSVYDDIGILDETNEASNPQGGEGTVSVVWSSDTTWLVAGNRSWIDESLADVDWEAEIDFDVTLVSAGDITSITGRTSLTQDDRGNYYSVRVVASGYYFRFD